MTETLVDAKGRKLTTREITVLDQVKLLRAIGPAQSSNTPYVRLVTAAAMVTMIDGTPMPMPVNERQIDAAIERLGDEGFAAIAVHMQAEQERVERAAEAAAEAGDATDPLPTSAT